MTQQLYEQEFVTTLIKSNTELQKLSEARQRRIDFLTQILEQRTAITRKQYHASDHEEMYNKVYEVFLARPARGITYEEAEEYFEADHGFHSANVGQRMRDLFRDGLLWKREDIPEPGHKLGKMRYYLKLSETEGEA